MSHKCACICVIFCTSSLIHITYFSCSLVLWCGHITLALTAMSPLPPTVPLCKKNVIERESPWEFDGKIENLIVCLCLLYSKVFPQMTKQCTFKLQEHIAQLAMKSESHKLVVFHAESVHMQYQSAASPSEPFEHVCNATCNIGKTNECRRHNENFPAIKQNFQHPFLVIYRVA